MHSKKDEQRYLIKKEITLVDVLFTTKFSYRSLIWMFFGKCKLTLLRKLRCHKHKVYEKYEMLHNVLRDIDV